MLKKKRIYTDLYKAIYYCNQVHSYCRISKKYLISCIKKNVNFQTGRPKNYDKIPFVTPSNLTRWQLVDYSVR